MLYRINNGAAKKSIVLKYLGTIDLNSTESLGTIDLNSTEKLGTIDVNSA